MFKWTKPWQLQIAGLGVAVAVLILTAGELYEHHINGWEDLEITVVGEILLFAGSILLGILLGVNISRQAGFGRPQVWLGPGVDGQAHGCRRVLVCADSLLTAGVGELLMHDPTLDIHRITPADEEALLSEISCFRPDALVLDHDSPLTQPARLLPMLPNCPQLRVVAVDANHDCVQVYDHARVGVAAIGDLVYILRNDREPSRAEDEPLATGISNHSPQLQA